MFFNWQFQLSSASCSSPLYVSPDLSSTCDDTVQVSPQSDQCPWCDPVRANSQCTDRQRVALSLVQELDRDADTFG